jgi:hypothetical protein
MNRLGTLALVAVSSLFLEVALPAGASAQSPTELVGTWRLVAFKVRASDTKDEKDALGPNPQGRLILTASGYITNYRVAAGRKPAQNDADRAQLLRTMAVWTGRYRVDGNKLLVKIDSSWNENDTGSERLRTYVLDGNKLVVSTVTPNSNFFEGRPASGDEYFERED